MIYIMLYIAVLIAALVWVGVIVARHQSGPIPPLYQDDDLYGYCGVYTNGPYGYGLYFQGFPLDDD